MICYRVNSAGYFHKTSGDLAKEVSTIIDPHDIMLTDMSEVQDEFSSVITKALVTLVRRLEIKFDTKMAELALSLVPRFYANIFRCKDISETGAQQMLVDTHAMKMILLEVPSLARQFWFISTTSYFEFVTHQMRRAEAVLKVIPSPIISVVDTYRAVSQRNSDGVSSHLGT